MPVFEVMYILVIVACVAVDEVIVNGTYFTIGFTDAVQQVYQWQ